MYTWGLVLNIGINMKIEKNIFKILIFMTFFYCLQVFGLNNAEVFDPEEETITMISGAIVDPSKTLSGRDHKLRDYQFRYAGYSCRTDQNGLYYFYCKKQKLSDPIFILISNGNYLISKDDALGDRSFSQPAIKQDPKKKYLFFKSIIKNNKLFFEKTSLDSYCFELPSERTITLNINPDYVEDYLLPSDKFFFHNRCLMIPNIKLKSSAEIYKIKKVVLKKEDKKNISTPSKTIQRVKDKSCFRKSKQIPHHEEIEIRQKMCVIKPNKKQSNVLISQSCSF
jgi:hypothetical protein